MTMAAATLTADKPQLRPDANGRFGKFGGKYVPETLIAALAELEQAYAEAQADPSFQAGHLSPGHRAGCSAVYKATEAVDAPATLMQGLLAARPRHSLHHCMTYAVEPQHHS